MEKQMLIPFIGYLLLIIAIGIYASRFSSKGIEEFFLGGRKMGRFVVALSAVVSGRSAWLMMGLAGIAYMKGLAALWAVAGYTFVEFLLFIYYAPRIRRYTEKHDCITIPDFYSARFNDKTGTLRILIVVIFILFMTAYVSAQFTAGGEALASSFEGFRLTPFAGLMITAGIVLLYTLLGGFMAVSYTDVLQGAIMILALVILPVAGIIDQGGWQKVVSAAQTVKPQHTDLFAIPALTIIAYLGIGLGSPGNPHILVRYMSIRDPKQFRWTAVVGTLWNLIMGCGAVMIGFVGRAVPKIAQLPEGEEETVFLQLASEVMSPFWVGLVLAALFAAIMSTADSQLLVAASSIVRDIYEKILRKNRQPDPGKLALYSRFSVLALVLMAVLFGIFYKDLIFWFVLFAWAGLGAAIGPTSILALFWRKTTKAGVIAGLLAGTATVILWKSSPALSDFMYELIPGFILSALATWIVSMISHKRGAV